MRYVSVDFGSLIFVNLQNFLTFSKNELFVKEYIPF